MESLPASAPAISWAWLSMASLLRAVVPEVGASSAMVSGCTLALAERTASRLWAGCPIATTELKGRMRSLQYLLMPASSQTSTNFSLSR